MSIAVSKSWLSTRVRNVLKHIDDSKNSETYHGRDVDGRNEASAVQGSLHANSVLGLFFLGGFKNFDEHHDLNMGMFSKPVMHIANRIGPGLLVGHFNNKGRISHVLISHKFQKIAPIIVSCESALVLRVSMHVGLTSTCVIAVIESREMIRRAKEDVQKEGWLLGPRNQQDPSTCPDGPWLPRAFLSLLVCQQHYISKNTIGNDLFLIFNTYLASHKAQYGLGDAFCLVGE